MPPKAKVNREMIVEAAYELIRESGESCLNARSIAGKLGCSTQPVLYCFKTMEEIREEVYRKADEFHSHFLMQGCEEGQNPLNVIWKNYLHFAVEEKNLFRFLFQSNAFSGRMQGLIEDERLQPVLQVMSEAMGISPEQAKKSFAALYYPVHGIASLLANNSMEYREEEVKEILDMIRRGILEKE